jgi:hypothetical protein
MYPGIMRMLRSRERKQRTRFRKKDRRKHRMSEIQEKRYRAVIPLRLYLM